MNEPTVIAQAREILMRDPYFLDTETTGLGRSAQIVEISIIDQRGEVLLDTLVKPTTPIPPDATRIHGITDRDVLGAPSFADLMPRLLPFLGFGRTIAIYNASYDTRLLQQSAKVHGIAIDGNNYRHVCVMHMYAVFHGAYNHTRHSYTWQSLSNAGLQQHIVLPPYLKPHRALADAEMTRLLMLRIAAG